MGSSRPTPRASPRSSRSTGLDAEVRRTVPVCDPRLLIVALALAGCEYDRVPASPAAPQLQPALRGAPPASLVSPLRLAVAPGARAILASDPQSDLVVELDAASLTPLGAARPRGKPLAVGMAGGRVFVGNATTRTIDVLHRNGRRAYSFGRDAVGYPSDLDVDANRGLLFVVDGLARDVKVFTLDGSLLRAMGGGGTFQAPIAIAVDTARREVLVSDYGNPDGGVAAAVKIHAYDGRYLTEISGRGRCGSLGCSGGFSRPQGLTVAGGRVFLADGLLAAVLVFDRATLSPVGTLGGRSLGPPYLRLPTDVVVGRHGDLFVASSLTGRVEVFRGAAAVP